MDVPSSPVHTPVQQLDIATDITCAKLTYSRLTHMEMPCVQNVPDNCNRVEYIKHSSYSIYQATYIQALDLQMLSKSNKKQ